MYQERSLSVNRRGVEARSCEDLGTYIEKSGIALAGKVRDFYTHLHLSFTLNKTETQDEADRQMRYTVLKPDSSKAPSRPPHPLLRQDGGMRARAGTQCNP